MLVSQAPPPLVRKLVTSPALFLRRFCFLEYLESLRHLSIVKFSLHYDVLFGLPLSALIQSDGVIGSFAPDDILLGAIVTMTTMTWLTS